MEAGINLDEKLSKPKSERKQLELPVQKNLLTKYFCFTSLEVRRNFKAPRTSPKSPSPSPTDCFTSDEKLSMEDTSSEIGCSFSSCTDSENAEDVSLNVNVRKDDFSSSIPQISNSPCPKPPASHSEDHLSSVLHQKHEGRIGSAVVRGGTRTENRKVIVKSRFFQDRQVNKDLQNKQDTSHDNDCYEANPVSTSTSVKVGEVKFGSNISHIDRYSNIAEKSVDRFVSVISSFRYSSSGSRASGLRAPLKDVTNSGTKRSPTCVELEQFAYEPAKKKTCIQLRQS